MNFDTQFVCLDCSTSNAVYLTYFLFYLNLEDKYFETISLQQIVSTKLNIATGSQQSWAYSWRQYDTSSVVASRFS